MSHTVRIKDDVYSLLADQASDAGVSPDVWVELKIKQNSLGKSKKISDRRKREAWENFIGATDSSLTGRQRKSSRSDLADRVKNTFREVVEQKMNRIGLKSPK